MTAAKEGPVPVKPDATPQRELICRHCDALFQGWTQSCCPACTESRRIERNKEKLRIAREKRAAAGCRSYTIGAPAARCACGNTKDYRATQCGDCFRSAQAAARKNTEPVRKRDHDTPVGEMCQWCGKDWVRPYGVRHSSNHPELCSDKCRAESKAHHMALAADRRVSEPEARYSSEMRKAHDRAGKPHKQGNDMPTVMELIAFPDPDVFLALIAEITEHDHRDKRTVEHRKSVNSPGSQALGRARSISSRSA